MTWSASVHRRLADVLMITQKRDRMKLDVSLAISFAQQHQSFRPASSTTCHLSRIILEGLAFQCSTWSLYINRPLRRFVFFFVLRHLFIQNGFQDPSTHSGTGHSRSGKCIGPRYQGSKWLCMSMRSSAPEKFLLTRRRGLSR